MLEIGNEVGSEEFQGKFQASNDVAISERLFRGHFRTTFQFD